MAIKTPDWAIKVGAFPTAKGWEVARPKGRTELIKAAKFSAADIAEWHGHDHAAAEPAPVVQTLHEAPHVEREVTHEEIAHHYDEHVEHEHHGDHHDAPLHHSGHWED